MDYRICHESLNMPSQRPLVVSIFSLILLFTALAFTAWVYWPGLYGPFLLDDMWNLGALSQRGGVHDWETAFFFIFSNVSGALGRPLSMATFLLSDNNWPSEEFSFKFFNLMIHLINGLLIFYFVYRVCLLAKLSEKRALFFSLFAASLWLLHPLNVSTTLYVIQRMTQLAALFSLLSLIFYIAGRQRLLNGREGSTSLILIGLTLFAACAVLSKENGVLVFVQIMLLDKLFFSRDARSGHFKKIYLALVVTPVVLLALYLAYKFPHFITRYDYRDFDMLERVYTQSRYLFIYLHYILVPRGTGTGLIHDDLVVSAGLLSPVTTLFSVLGWSGLIALAYVLRHKAVLVSYGIGFFLVGHLLESTFIPLELYYEHRNYLPMLGVFFVLIGLANLILDTETKPLGRVIVAGIVVLYLISAVAVTKQQVRHWSNLFDLLTIWATEHPDSLRAQRIYGQYLGRGQAWANEGVDVLSDIYARYPDDISLPIIMLNIACKQEVEVPVTLDDVKAATARAYYHGGLITPVKNFADLYIDGKCATSRSRRIANEVLLDLAKVHGMKGGQKADLTFFHAEKYAEAGNLNMAMDRLDVAAMHQKDFVVPFRQADYLATAGLYDEALQYLSKSRELDRERSRKWLVPSNEKLISLMEKQIVAAKKARNNQQTD